MRDAELTVRFEGMRMLHATGLGDSAESGQVLSVEYEGECGAYQLAMYVDSLPTSARPTATRGRPEPPPIPERFSRASRQRSR
ncbi:hypothetical protein ACFZAR_27365 [Streptomyces sp. NPDC008222]|uniref:hypothetical protein n=1 Tax=Streptomyces sp. NPDC008222 TaxID=3364820 RepID=UPI0036E30924